MAKNYTLDSVENLIGRIKFNHQEGVDEDNNSLYYIIRIEFVGRGVNGGAVKTSTEGLNIGNPQTEKFTPKEIYTKIQQSMGNAIANKLKDLYLDLIDDDISA